MSGILITFYEKRPRDYVIMYLKYEYLYEGVCVIPLFVVSLSHIQSIIVVN